MSGVRFAEDADPAGLELDQNQARKLFEEGAVFVLKDVPTGTEFGIDANSWNTGDKFLGVKMIPPGLHFIYYSACDTSADGGGVAPRTGFFHYFKKGELLALRWDPVKEMAVDDISAADQENMGTDLRNMDRRLGAYPYQTWSKWLMLTSRLTEEEVDRLSPVSRTICAAAEMLPDSREDREKSKDDLPSLIPRPGTEIRFTAISRQKYPAGANAAEITKHNMDATYQLQTLIKDLPSVNSLLSELQFALLCFLVGQNFDSFEHWKLLVDLVCGCSEGLLKYPDLFKNFMTDLFFQMQEIPQDFFVDIISQNNFLVRSLTNLFENIRETEGVSPQLTEKAVKFEQFASKKFCWSFCDDADDENAPVVVDTL